MVDKIAAAALLCAVALAPLPAAAQAPPPAQSAPAAQAAPAAATTAGFSAFLSDILAGRVPPNISPAMKSQSTTMLTQVKSLLAPLGNFRRLTFLREDSLQGYHRYHYTAVFDKGSQGVVFITDSSGTIVGFGNDQPGQ
jgi:hypothetical protein